MSSRPSAYYRPKSVDEALELLNRPDTVPLGGGTKLLAGEQSAAVVDLQALGLDTITFQTDMLTIGAMSRLSDLSEYLAGLDFRTEEDQENGAQLLQKAIRQAGPNTYRNAATIGGTIASRLQDSELTAALLAMDGRLNIIGSESVTMSLSDYLEADERPSGLIVGLELDWVSGDGKSARVARTPADYPIVSVTAWFPRDENVRLAATGIAARPVRLWKAEASLSEEINERTIGLAATAAAERCRHPGDFRGDSAYRSAMAAVLTKRVLSP